MLSRLPPFVLLPRVLVSQCQFASAYRVFPSSQPNAIRDTASANSNLTLTTHFTTQTFTATRVLQSFMESMSSVLSLSSLRALILLGSCRRPLGDHHYHRHRLDGRSYRYRPGHSLPHGQVIFDARTAAMHDSELGSSVLLTLSRRDARCTGPCSLLSHLHPLSFSRTCAYHPVR